MSERTRARMATWPDERRLAFGLASIEEVFQALLAEERRQGFSQEEAAERVRARLRAWRR